VPQDTILRAEIIAIGDELTSGQRLDTNSQWLSQQLGDLGIRTLFHTTVADDLASNIDAFRAAAKRVDVVVATGGLGPTADDLTRECMAQAFERPLKLDQVSLDTIKRMFESRGREMPERNRVQAMFPEGSQAIPNPNGTAPGVDLTSNTCRLFALPGVPAEMKEMWIESVNPRLLEQFGKQLQPLFHYRLKCFGTGESALEAMLPDLIRRGRVPTVGITVSKATITLRASAQAVNEAKFRELIQPTLDTIREALGEYVFGEEDEELQHAVSRLLAGRNQSVAVSEWGSGGLVASWLEECAPEAFAGGFLVNSRESAKSLLDIDGDIESLEFAKAMAVSTRQRVDADYGVSVGPFPATPKSQDAKVFLGLATRESAIVVGRRFAGHPEILKPRAAKQALDELRKHLLRD